MLTMVYILVMTERQYGRYLCRLVPEIWSDTDVSGYCGIGLVQPNSRIDAAMLATCSRLCVRGLAILGISWSTTRKFSRPEGTLAYVAWIAPMPGAKIVISRSSRRNHEARRQKGSHYRRQQRHRPGHSSPFHL